MRAKTVTQARQKQIQARYKAWGWPPKIFACNDLAAQQRLSLISDYGRSLYPYYN